MEAIIPIENGVPILRAEIPKKANAAAVTKDLNMTYELREAAIVHLESY